MPQVLVWKSTADNKLFEDKSQYQRHLRVLATARQAARKFKAAVTVRDAFFAQMAQIPTVKDLEQFVRDNWSHFFYNGLARSFFPKKNKGMHNLAYFELDVKWYDQISNTHHCPTNGVTNFRRNAVLENGEPAPRSYPGWKGRLEIGVITPKNYDGYGSAYFENSIIKTGSGGGGYNNKKGETTYSYEVYLFAEDFLGLLKTHEQEQIIHALSGTV